MYGTRMFKTAVGAGKMAQWLRAHVALAEEGQGSAPTTTWCLTTDWNPISRGALFLPPQSLHTVPSHKDTQNKNIQNNYGHPKFDFSNNI